MKIAVFGTGSVGQTISAKLVSMGYEVMIGTRDVNEARSRTAADMYGNPGFATWIISNNKVKLGTFADAASFGDLLVNATSGGSSVEAIKSAKTGDLKGKILIDIANPLDFSKGMPPCLIPSLSNTFSLGEELQKEFPEAKVVKTLNTMWCGLMVNPVMIGNGDHVNYLCGNDSGAKNTVKDLLKKFGWKEENLLDLGDITNSRGTEAVLPIWLRVWGATGTGAFNFRIVR
ncbi:MAG: NADP oxidoreductase [Bacteroidetes bacterium GWE2_41_25]|nr:MAG: NADP oxidoreductase [Bacteroidetes bacterium GWA2_40_15]OFX97224.1 MAG: NADP oxidoreductase [Bacteroidetes bacterium GWC2_40_22]OFY05118.1 MAG: NADP oxidoreductase [Bacteroidetes bacterium GWE2_41_25]OFY58290.1 MAG: NADP oxidoreductase [Bacteroidetes bacterium GWF2_41_9]HAM11474.1 NADP oxidoreductase [Bacteroidales bacterium]